MRQKIVVPIPPVPGSVEPDKFSTAITVPCTTGVPVPNCTLPSLSITTFISSVKALYPSGASVSSKQYVPSANPLKVYMLPVSLSTPPLLLTTLASSPLPSVTTAVASFPSIFTSPAIFKMTVFLSSALSTKSAPVREALVLPSIFCNLMS